MSEKIEAPEAIVADKYRLTKMLGRGGMGSVWEGVHVGLGTRVAVKFIDQAHAHSEEIRNRFVNEAKAAARLKSKHVVKVFDQGVTPDGRPYIVMEYLEGEPLDARLDREGRLSLAETASILLQVARALRKAHELGIVHRDLKPENVFLVWDDEDQRDVAKVVDFGIAKFTDAEVGASSGSTRTGAVLGTPHYMSPEQARGLKSVDSRTDVWAAGVIAFRAITGTLPFEGEAVGDLLVKICTAEAPAPTKVAADLPPGVDAWMERALAKDAEARFQTATELAESLANIAGLDRGALLGGPVVSSRKVPQPAPRSAQSTPDGTGAPITTTIAGGTSRAPVFIGLGAVVVAGIAGAAFFLGGADAADEPTPEPTVQAVGATAPDPASTAAEPAAPTEPAEPAVEPALPESAEPAESAGPPKQAPSPAPVVVPAPKVAKPVPRPKAAPRPAPAPVAAPAPRPVSKPAPAKAPDLLGY